MFDIPSENILALYASNDSHQSNNRVREFWKYGASIGLSGTPAAFVNGVMLDDYPQSADEWKVLFESLYPSKDEYILMK